MSENIPTTPLVHESNLWQPGEAPRGFRVQMLAEQPVSVPAENAFCSTAELIDTINQRYIDGDGIRILGASETSAPSEVEVDFTSIIWIKQAELAAAVEQGRVPAAVAQKGAITLEETEKYGVVGAFPEHEQMELEARLGRQLGEHYFKPDWAHLPAGMVERQEYLSQIINFEAAGRQVNLYNFTKTQLSAENVGKIANALREMCDHTGGSVMEMLDVMAIVPNDDPVVSPIDEKGEIMYSAQAVAPPGSVVFAEKLINPDTTQPEIAVQTPEWRTHGPDESLFVEGDRIQLATFHELTHVVAANGRAQDYRANGLYAEAVGWEWSDESSEGDMPRRFTKRGSVDHPIIYGRKDYQEDLAVTAESHFAGQGHTLDDARRLGIAVFWAQRHSHTEGPLFVNAVEIPLPVAPAKIGQLSSAPLAVKQRYGYMVNFR